MVRKYASKRKDDLSFRIALKLLKKEESISSKEMEILKKFVEGACTPRGKNPGDFMGVTTEPVKEVHFATYPKTICVIPILSSCPPEGVVLDPMCGSGQTLMAVKLINLHRWEALKYKPNEKAKRTRWNLKYIGIDINSRYVEITKKRLSQIPDTTLLEFSD